MALYRVAESEKGPFGSKQGARLHIINSEAYDEETYAAADEMIERFEPESEDGRRTEGDSEEEGGVLLEGGEGGASDTESKSEDGAESPSSKSPSSALLEEEGSNAVDAGSLTTAPDGGVTFPTNPNAGGGDDDPDPSSGAGEGVVEERSSGDPTESNGGSGGAVVGLLAAVAMVGLLVVTGDRSGGSDPDPNEGRDLV
jgi:cobalamin biosynthesis Mg chelatase CobN